MPYNLLKSYSRSLTYNIFGLRTRRKYSTFSATVSDPHHKIQSYISESNDPYLNLSVEQFLLKQSPPDSAVLFIYINRPCIVIGRNQNPWLEINLSRLLQADQSERANSGALTVRHVDIVRRHSGGGTVFHDEGNVNWSVICPSEEFTRDKHAEMIVQALRDCGIDRARVNERHDVVLDQGAATEHKPDPSNYHQTSYEVDHQHTGPKSIKVSGSAYRLTRGRALHHGTCLLSSPNLKTIPALLRSPARPFLKAKGVESVSSPIGNIGLDTNLFTSAVRKEFAALYQKLGTLAENHIVSNDLTNEPAIAGSWSDMQEAEWIYGQTPQFEFSVYAVNSPGYHATSFPSDLPTSINIFLQSKHGQVTQFNMTTSSDKGVASTEALQSNQVLQGQRLYEAKRSWKEAVQHAALSANQQKVLAEWLNTTLPMINEKP